MTLVELMVGMVVAGVIAGVCAKVLLLGIKTYNYATRQNDSLSRTRKALGGEGSSMGLLSACRGATAVSALDPASVAVVSGTSAAVTSYYISGDSLYASKSGVVSLQADSISSLAVNYYNMDDSGLIRLSSAAASATLVTALVTVQSKNNTQKDYRLYAGAMLRNHP